MNSIRITEVRVSLRDDSKLKAFASILLNDVFVIRGLKVIEGNGKRMFVAMPSRKRPDGKHQDVAHPLTQTLREYIEEMVIAEYRRELWRQRETGPEELGVGARLLPPPDFLPGAAGRRLPPEDWVPPVPA